MTVMESQALTDLLARAGAPDTDRPRWIAERMTGVTATEIRDLVIGKVRDQALIDMKLGRTSEPGDLSHVPIIGWGREREAAIAAELRGMGIEPESRVFHSERDSRHLASPDGIGVEFDGAVCVSEIKTSSKDIQVGTPAYEATGYALQMQWSMWVTGADRCLYAFEERLTVEGRFVPGRAYFEWVERDEDVIAALVMRADEFLAELDRQREDGAPVIDEELDTHAVNYLRGLAAEKEGKELKESAYAAVVAAGKSQESPLARVTYTPEKAGEVLEVEEIDYEAARAAGGELFDALQTAQRAWDEHMKAFVSTKPVQGKSRAASARITAGKGTRDVS